ncbi:MAG: glucosamine--fructose-6-phosphate aminotransferase [bacterium ADurb.Bin429]|nr:MAG: glucosamine--fructose-6-phosphate aminotransferase [bacterium ADurb.Bin429]
MCGLCGICIGRLGKRRVRDIEALTDTFTRLLLLSEHRGLHATGVAWVKRDGTMQLAKEPLPPVLVTHNGTILEHTRHAVRLRLRQATRVDSELLARIAQHHTGMEGIELNAFLTELHPLDGSMSLALVATTQPEDIILLKGNMPLEVRVHQRTRALLYASETRILDRAIGDQDGWEPLPLAYGEGLVINTQAWTLQRMTFTFQGLNNMAGHSYTGTNTKKERQR